MPYLKLSGRDWTTILMMLSPSGNSKALFRNRMAVGERRSTRITRGSGSVPSKQRKTLPWLTTAPLSSFAPEILTGISLDSPNNRGAKFSNQILHRRRSEYDQRRVILLEIFRLFTNAIANSRLEFTESSKFRQYRWR